MTDVRHEIALGVALLTVFFAAACGEHPCTLGVGEPACTTNPEEATPFCTEACAVCDDVQHHRWESACRARCRSEAGMSDLVCEELDAGIEAAYRECVETIDYGPCERWRSGKP